MGKEHHTELTLVESTIKANEKQKLRMVEKIKEAMGDLNGKIISALGLTFKPGTDDMRAAPSLVIIPELVKAGATIRAFDPQGLKEAPWRFKDIEENIYYAHDEYDAAAKSDAIVIITDWTSFRNLDFNRLKASMKDNYFFDLRNIYKRSILEDSGFKYYGVGV